MTTRTSQTFTVSLPRDLAEEVDRVARAENRTRSELVREAFRQYVQRRRRWAAIFKYGEEAGERAGVRSEEDVARIVSEWREQHHA
jgi:predicted transcriptional regulator